jgi:uncharacterized protein (TIGR03437 family)
MLTILNQSYALALISARSDLVVVLVPGDLPPGTGTVTVTYTGGISDPATVQIVDATFGIATQLGTGYGPAFASNVVGDAATMNTLLNPARPGQELIVYGTGLGVSGERPIVWVGNFSAPIVDTGPLGPSYPGIEQIQILIPEGIEGCYVPIAVQVGMSVSNFASLAISATDGACSDPLSYTKDELEAIRNKETIRVGTITVLQRIYDSATARFFEYSRDALLQSLAVFGTPPLGTCTVNNFLSRQPPVQPIRPLDAGPRLNLLNVPGGALPNLTYTLSPDMPGGYSLSHTIHTARLAAPGPLQLTGPGGADIGAFTAGQIYNGNWTDTEGTWSSWVPGEPAQLQWLRTAQPGYYEFDWTLPQERRLVCSIKPLSVDGSPFAEESFQVPGFVTLAIAQRNQDGSLGMPTVGATTAYLAFASLPTRFTAPGLDLGFFFSPGY